MRSDFRAPFLPKIGAALLASIAMAGLGCGSEAGDEPMLRPVRFVEVSTGAEPQARTFSGAARAGTESRLSFKVAGTIQTLRVVVGSRVSTGELIAALDPSDYLLTEQESLASLRQAEAQARNADESYQRVKGLYENNNASKSDLESARAGAESARQAVKLGETRLEQARLQVEYARLIAPTAGAIAQVDVEVNENVQPGRQIVLMTSGDRPEVQVAVPEQHIGRIAIGDEASVRIDALPGSRFAAVVHEVGVAAVGTATTFPVTVQLDEAETGIRPGMAAEVTLKFRSIDRSQSVLIVPSTAVSEDREGRFVFVLDPTGEAEAGVRRQAVSVGEITSAGIEVTEGLAEGALVATAGLSHLREGQRVKLLQEDSN